MKTPIVRLFSVCIFLLVTAGDGGEIGGVIDVSGTWSAIETTAGKCAGDVYPIEQTEIFTITQYGSNLSITLASMTSKFGTSMLDYEGTVSEDPSGLSSWRRG